MQVIKAPATPSSSWSTEQVCKPVASAAVFTRLRQQQALAVDTILSRNGIPMAVLPASSTITTQATSKLHATCTFKPTVKCCRILEWKDTPSEERLLSALGLRHAADKVRAAAEAEAAAALGADAGNGSRQNLQTLGSAVEQADADRNHASLSSKCDQCCPAA